MRVGLTALVGMFAAENAQRITDVADTYAKDLVKLRRDCAVLQDEKAGLQVGRSKWQRVRRWVYHDNKSVWSGSHTAACFRLGH